MAWPKGKSLGNWSGGISFEKPVNLDGAAVAGHHAWETEQSNAQARTRSGFIPTWSAEFLEEYRARKLTGWQVMNEMQLIHEG